MHFSKLVFKLFKNISSLARPAQTRAADNTFPLKFGNCRISPSLSDTFQIQKIVLFYNLAVRRESTNVSKMYHKIITAKVLILLHILNVLSDEIEDAVNTNMYDSKNLMYRDGNSVLSKLLTESRFNSDIIKSVGKDSDTVNHYEDITILGDDGQLKNLKYKSAFTPKKENVQNLVTKVNNKVTQVTSDNQIEVPVTIDDKDNSKITLSAHKSKFFDELGCKYYFSSNDLNSKETSQSYIE